MGRFCFLWLPTPHFLTTPWDFIDSTTGLGGTKGINVENATLSMALPERQRKLFIKNFKSSKPSQEFPQEKNLKDTHIIYKSKVSSSRSRCDGRGRHLHLKALVLHHLRLISPCQSAVGKFPPHSPRSFWRKPSLVQTHTCSHTCTQVCTCTTYDCLYLPAHGIPRYSSVINACFAEKTHRDWGGDMWREQSNPANKEGQVMTTTGLWLLGKGWN